MSSRYKKLISFFFKQIYGTIESSTINNNNIKIHKFKIDNKKYQIFELINCRVYTNTIQDTAFIQNNKIIEKASFQIRNLINSDIKNNVVYKIGTPRFIKKFESPILCLLTGGAGNNNYWHWMYDVLPRIAIIEKKFSLKKFKHIYVPDKKYLFQLDTLDILNIKKKSISSKKNKHIISKKIIATNHPWQHSNSAHDDIGKVPKWITLWLRSKFLRFKSKKNYFKKIYIDRSDTNHISPHNRKIINEENLKKILIKKNFHIIKLLDYNFKEQIGIFNSAKVIIGNHGAGFTNLIFCKKKTKVIEFKNKYTSKMFEKISKDVGLSYSPIVCPIVDINNKNQNNNIKVPIKRLLNLI